jgi:hypothetical protein
LTTNKIKTKIKKLALCIALSVCVAVSLGWMSSQDTATLMKTADEVLAEVSKLRQLPVKSPIAKGVESREEIRSYLAERVKEEYTPEELNIEGRVLKKLRLIPQDMDLYEFAMNLLTEQVAGYYDPKTKTFYIADWLSAEAQKPIMAHELTHALQDQYFDVTPFLKRIKHNDDKMLARNSILEGEAVAVMIDYMLEPMGMTFLKLPDVKQFMGMAEAMNSQEYKIFATAPAYFKETLVFPYTSGLSFMQAYRRNHSWADVAKLYRDLPDSTEQIMHPEKYMTERDEPTEVKPEVPKQLPGNGWKSIYQNVLGEFTTQLVLKEFLDQDQAEKAAAGWDGDCVELLQNKAGKEAVVMRFVFDTDQDATEFTDAYTALLAKKYVEKSNATVTQDGVRVEVVEY